jgi:tetrapyrrole methylase family protein/MazG family protein
VSPRGGLITVVGLGPGDADMLTIAVRELLASVDEIWVRTARHPSVQALPTRLMVRSCDDLYEAHESFEEVYRAIAERLLGEATHGDVVYGVPGDPTVGEAAVGILCREAAARGCRVTVLPGVSFVGPVLALVGWDALDGLQIADATVLAEQHFPSIDPDRPALVAQVYSRLVAGDAKVTLLNQYPPEHPVTIVSGAGTAGAHQRTVPLAEMDREEAFDDLTTVALPPLPHPGSLLSLAEVVARLRAPDGCPWDRQQTHESLRPYLLEETYEVLACLDSGDPAALADELGDLLLQIVLHAQLAIEAGDFGLADVIRAITEKIVRRHPHVFAEGQADTAEEVLEQWDTQKAQERESRGDDDPFAGVPFALPALSLAQLVQRKAAVVGGTASPQGGGAEVAEVRAGDAATTGSPARKWQRPRDVEAAMRGLDGPAADELERARRIGAALWAVAALARGWGVDAEMALRDASERHVAEVRERSRGARAAAAPAGPTSKE